MFAFSVIKYREQPATFCYARSGRFSVGSEGQQGGVRHQVLRVRLERGTLGSPAAAALPWGIEGREVPAPTLRWIALPWPAFCCHRGAPGPGSGPCPYPGRLGRAGSPRESVTP